MVVVGLPDLICMFLAKCVDEALMYREEGMQLYKAKGTIMELELHNSILTLEEVTCPAGAVLTFHFLVAM